MVNGIGGNKLISRSAPKKSSLKDAEDDGCDFVVPLKASPATNLSDDDEKRKGKDSIWETRGFCCWLTAMIVMNVIIYHFITPPHVKAAQKKALDEQLFLFSQKLQEQKSLTEALLDDRTKSLGVLRNSQTLAEKMAAQTEHVLEQASDADKAKLEADMKEQQAALKDLGLSIAEKEDEVKVAQASIENMKVDMGRFCENCVFNRQKFGRGVTCKGRMDYLMKRHGTKKDDAIEAVMKWEPVNCVN